jgi:cytochrome P450 family 9
MVLKASSAEVFRQFVVKLRSVILDMRATLSPMFTGSKMRTMYEHVTRVGQQSAVTLKEQMKASGENVIEFKSLAIALKVTDFGNFKTTLKFVAYLVIPPVMRFLKISLFSKEIENFFQEAVHETMKYREEKGIVRHDMIHLLMQAKKGKLSHETKMEEKITDGFATVEESQLGKAQVKRVWDDEDLAAQCFIFFFAGFDTVS